MIIKFKRKMVGLHYQWDIEDKNGPRGNVKVVNARNYVINFDGNTTTLEYEQQAKNHQNVDGKENFQIAKGKFSDEKNFTLSQGHESDYIKFIAMQFYEIKACDEQTIGWKVGFGLKGTSYLCIYKMDKICAIVEADKWHIGEYTLYCEDANGIETWLIYILAWDLELMLTDSGSRYNLLNSGKKAREKYDPEFIKKIKNMEISDQNKCD